MARKLGKAQASEIEDGFHEEVEEGESEPESDDDDAAIPKSKAGAARAALAAGIVIPKIASAHIKKKYGIDISPQQFSAEKSRLKSRAGGYSSYAKLDRSGGKVDGYLAQPPRQNRVGDSHLLEAMEAMKPLIAELGAEQVKRMVDLLG